MFITEFTTRKRLLEGYLHFHQPASGIEALNGLIFMEYHFQKMRVARSIPDTTGARQAFIIGIGAYVSKLVLALLAEAKKHHENHPKGGSEKEKEK